MALSQKQIEEVRDYLKHCKRPLFFFDDDQDGVTAFVQLYKLAEDGKGVIVKTSPRITTKAFLKITNDYQPDKIFILDIAEVDQEFIDEVKVPVIWIDHHGPYERENVHYYNPRISNNDNHPTSYMAYQIAQGDIWIATLGCVADWLIPPFLDEFRKKYPDLIENEVNHPGDVIFNSRFGKLIRIFSFVLKGKTNEVMKCVKILTRVKEPYEILDQTTSQGKYIYKAYEKMNKLFEPLYNDFMEKAKEAKDKMIVYTYKDDQTSFTSDLSNEAIYRFPDKVILVAREKNGDMKGSLRSTKAILPPIIEKALVGLQGYGGGHEHACGLNVKVEDFDEFVERIKAMV